ncbi:MAG: DeoR/GlpR family DNA-binding transcription regulator [Rhodospirillum sp.]|nr:DeoR/GlpR family DNA-binding transcription regulator [Rhodospirillum sp.]MCF8490805.1 DeoR/GlpR family DNA-binding transcription regulator [Rhodospirillum sp.]MCF8501749.1 DeoR/GlpR family DNA-binding transcription regulator [Rhodospirillum sp.]
MFRKRAERLQYLSGILETGGFLRLKDAADMLGVSEMTVRRDIGASQDRFTYLGGHITLESNNPGGMGYILNKERASNADKKRAACQAAATLIRPHDTLFIDCGTTTPHLASLLPSNSGLTVVCYAMNVAEIICKKPGIRVILLGGLYHESSASFSSPEALETLSQMGINKAFISAGGLHRERGVSCSNFHEVAIKQLAMANAESKILVVDSTKFGVVKPVFFSDTKVYDTICVDNTPIPADVLPPSVERGKMLLGDVGRTFQASR